jgi:hypothetical protein
MATPEQDTTELLALGVAGYALTMQLMAKLEAQGHLSRDDGAGVLDATLSALERSYEKTPHEAIRIARRVLDAQLKLWQRDRPRE